MTAVSIVKNTNYIDTSNRGVEEQRLREISLEYPEAELVSATNNFDPQGTCCNSLAVLMDKQVAIKVIEVDEEDTSGFADEARLLFDVVARGLELCELGPLSLRPSEPWATVRVTLMGWGTGTDEDGCGRKFLVCSDRDLWGVGKGQYELLEGGDVAGRLAKCRAREPKADCAVAGQAKSLGAFLTVVGLAFSALLIRLFPIQPDDAEWSSMWLLTAGPRMGTVWSLLTLILGAPFACAYTALHIYRTGSLRFRDFWYAAVDTPPRSLEGRFFGILFRLLVVFYAVVGIAFASRLGWTLFTYPLLPLQTEGLTGFTNFTGDLHTILENELPKVAMGVRQLADPLLQLQSRFRTSIFSNRFVPFAKAHP
ncbi:hypothetical protein AK812_SmicGene17694 [Symbiodinium microadriaticum]|uniref:Uncharacterized protein n=1 Tax=Symbiodinium microadriaticum TaxID=2951 RepID=A0A1Q9DX23_SYMMI|nr:hypothetical protein AK812_SmicGene17694 [Symbiodinium microadriaticum]